MNILRLATRMAVITCICIAAFSVNLYAQTPALWGNLDPGPYDVGFKVIYKYDHSRNWKPKYDLDKRLSSGVRARPIRISVWYPAKKLSSAFKMPYRDYVHYEIKDVAFSEVNSALERRNVASLRQVLKGEQVFNALLKTKMFATPNAVLQTGAFPLIVYSSGLNESWQNANVVLCEYLASHGYVVATVPQLGTTSLRLDLEIYNPIDLETQVRDLEFAIGVMREFPNVDRDKLGLVGHSLGGVATLLLQLRNTEIDAVIGLDASYGSGGRLSETLTKSPYYRPERMRVPLLDLRRPNERLDLSSLEAFRYSDRYYLELPGIFHSDFTSFPMIALRFQTNIRGRTPETASRGYQVVCRYVLNFLDAYLKRDEHSLRFVNNKPENNGIPEGAVKFSSRKGLVAPPTEEELVAIILRDGVQKAIKIYREFKEKEPQQPIIRESVLTSLGYNFIAPDPQIATAIDIFKLVVEAHPTSANAYDSLAEAYMLNGDKTMAIKYYEKVLEVLQSDPNASEESKNSLKNNALEKLKELKQ